MKKRYLYCIIAIAVIAGILVAGWYLGDTPETESATVSIEQDFEEEKEETEIPAIEQPEIEKQEIVPSMTEKSPVGTVVEKTADVEEQKTLCALTVDCSDILNDIETLAEEKRSLITENGIIFSLGNIEFKEGESAFDVLKRELRKAGIPMEFSLTPVYNSAYIEGINNIYEFDCGERSGWKYSVNGTYPPVSCSDYKLNDGDKIRFVYKINAY